MGVVNYVNGLRQGQEINYYESGEIWIVLNRKNDNIQGDVKEFLRSGELKSKKKWIGSITTVYVFKGSLKGYDKLNSLCFL